MMSNVVNYTYIQVQINGTLNEPYKSTPANSHPNSFHQQPHNHDMSLLRMICTWFCMDLPSPPNTLFSSFRSVTVFGQCQTAVPGDGIVGSR